MTFVIDRRRRCRRYLRRRFGLDIQRPWLIPTLTLPASEHCKIVWMMNEYILCTKAFWAGLQQLSLAERRGERVGAALDKAAKAMLNVWQRRPLVEGVGMECEDDTVKWMANCFVSGWASTQMNLKEYKWKGRILGNRLKKALLAELRMRGDDGRTAFSLLLERLPAITY